jgi:hypothetical protein
MTGAADIGGAGGTTGTATFAPTYQAVFTEILANASAGNCTFGVCHGGDPDPVGNGNLHMFPADPAATYDALVGVTSTGPECMGMPLVTPGQPAASLLARKLRPNPPCGSQMPFGEPLSERQIVQIETWIRDGANE